MKMTYLPWSKLFTSNNKGTRQEVIKYTRKRNQPIRNKSYTLITQLPNVREKILVLVNKQSTTYKHQLYYFEYTP